MYGGCCDRWAGGVAQRLLAVVERAGFEECDVALAEVLVHVTQCEVVPTYIYKVLLNPCLCVALGAHTLLGK